jgi:NAD(P)-dependent dehydrogenase (short-subunit alcohol dehydrogenase family)
LARRQPPSKLLRASLIKFVERQVNHYIVIYSVLCILINPVLITGISPNGLGEAMILALTSRHPSSLLLTARTISKAQSIADTVHASFPSITIQTIHLDLSDMSSVRQAASTILKSTPNIDILINNAGVMGLPTRTLSKDGIETHLATNFLGHFLLTNLLYPILTPSTSRIINITSGGYLVTPFRFSDYNFSLRVSSLPPSEQPNEAAIQMLGIPDYLSTKETYVPLIAYLHSNMANVLFSTALAGKGVQAFSATPGVVVTELQRYMPEGFRNPVMFYKSASQGAATFLVAALDPALKGMYSLSTFGNYMLME